jgi:hypothetical protein
VAVKRAVEEEVAASLTHTKALARRIERENDTEKLSSKLIQ